MRIIKNQKLYFSFFIISTAIGCSSGLSSVSPSNDIGNGNLDTQTNESLKPSSDTEARYFFVRGELALKQDDYKEAIEYFEKSKKVSTQNSPTLYKRLAQLYIRDGRLNEALKATANMETYGAPLSECYKLRAGILNALSRKAEALEVYKKLVDISTKDDEEHFLLLSGSYIQESKFNEAIDVLNNLYNKNPESFVANYYLAKLYVTTKNLTKSITHYKKAIELNPSADQVSLEYAKVLILSNKTKEATEICTKIVSDNPDNLKAKELLNELIAGEQKIEDAISEFEEAKKSGKNSVDLQFKVALLKLQQRDFKGAESEFNLILSQMPDNDEARYYLATAYASQEKLTAAIDQLNKISTKNDLYKKARGFAAFLLRQDNKDKQALATINEALVIFPDDLELLGYKLSIERDTEDTKAAVQTLRKIHSIEPDNEQHLFNLAVGLDEAKERKEAMSLMEEVIKKNPQHANALNYIGYTLAEENKDLDRAEKLIREATEIEKDNGFFLDSLGWVLFKKEKYKEALPILEKSVKLTNGDPVIIEHLARVYLALKNNEKAIYYFNQALEKINTSTKESDIKLRSEIVETLRLIQN